jgi:hypothetical protein
VLSPRKGRLPTITQVKVLSPEMMLPQEGEGVVVSEASIAVRVNGECISDVPGSEAMVGTRVERRTRADSFMNRQPLSP